MNNSLNVCIVDDDDVYQFTMKISLKSFTSVNKILAFFNGEEAMNFMLDNLHTESELPDVIFLDINMPIIDGFQFMEEYAKIKPEVGKKITVFMVSSSVDPIDIERAKKISEISDYIIKPIRENQLKTILAGLEENGQL